MMRTLNLLFFSCLCSISPLLGDVLKIETNNWSDKRDLTWTCRFARLDRESGLAHFTYRNGSQRIPFAVHYSRIYSLTIDDEDRVNKPFPKTREDLTKGLVSRKNKPRSIELSNGHFVDEEIPVGVRQKVQGNKIFLSGTVLAVTAEELKIKARAQGKSLKEFELDREHLLRWVR